MTREPLPQGSGHPACEPRPAWTTACLSLQPARWRSRRNLSVERAYQPSAIARTTCVGGGFRQLLDGARNGATDAGLKVPHKLSLSSSALQLDSLSERFVRERPAQAVVACGSFPAETFPGALCPFFVCDHLRLSRQVVSEHELAGPGAFGDAPDRADIGMERGHPLDGGANDAVPFEVVEVGNTMDEDVGTLGEADEGVADSCVAGEHHGTVNGVKTVSERRHCSPVSYWHGGHPDGLVLENVQRDLGRTFIVFRDGDVDGPHEGAGVGHMAVQRHDVQVVCVAREDGGDQVRSAGERERRLDRGLTMENSIAGRLSFRWRRTIDADRW